MTGLRIPYSCPVTVGPARPRERLVGVFLSLLRGALGFAPCIPYDRATLRTALARPVLPAYRTPNLQARGFCGPNYRDLTFLWELSL